MASAKIILFNSPSKQLRDGTFPVCLKVTHQRKRKYFHLGKRCTLDQWNTESSRFKRKFPDYKKENDVLLKLEGKASDILREFERDSIAFSFEMFKTKFLDLEQSTLVVDVFENHIDKLHRENKPSSAAPFQSTLNSLLKFLSETKKNQSRDFKLTHIDYSFLVDYEHWLRTIRMCKDTSIAVYMKQLRSIYNKAIKAKIADRKHYPFHEYRLDERLKLKTSKRAINKETVYKIDELTFPDHSKEQFAKNIFLFSYYTRGMNFVDIAKLEPKNIIGNRLEYERSKTKQPFSIELLDPARKIIDFYLNHKPTEGDYIFPVYDDAIHKTANQKFHRRKTVLRDVNKSLKTIAELIGMKDLNLTTYVSRHTFATTLKKAGVSIAKISESLGHQSEKVTETYLKQFENDQLDEAAKNLL